ncbi:DUF805 domain-containing protein [Labedella populi]|uniref:DUF805 domain-containing protein n=1 Tax=Labedella populi TaxID=2498850 RepID=A0A3S4BD42_9MICO|nr:DUF805 domain-containing protein [Labedella populi]RWZ67847.1 DUF805 domain-containing protein [Labedella populi]
MRRVTAYTPPLDQPYYRAPFLPAIGRIFRKYATFSGRAGRAEFWWWYLVATAFPVVVRLAYGAATGDWEYPPSALPSTIIGLFSLATFIPTLAVTWRRLHDTNRTGAWWLFGFIPILGWIVLLVFTLQAPVPEGRRYDAPRYLNAG